MQWHCRQQSGIMLTATIQRTKHGMLVKQALSCLPGGCRNALLRPAYMRATSPVSCLVSKSHYISQSRTRPSWTTRGSENRELRFSALTSRRQLSASQSPGSPASATATAQVLDPDSQPLAPYSPPTTGLLSILPSSWVPYAELVRLDKPTGTYYLYWPCLFSTLMAAPLAMPMASPLSVVGTSLLFFSGALIMRGAGCTINDLWDRNLDPHVRRTRLRPIARGAVTPFKALVFTGGQLLAGLTILLQFPMQCLWYGIPSLAFVASYPLMKRITYYPQVVLGLTFSWGAVMGFPALGVDLLQNNAALTAAGCLYASNIAWTVLYDMIYAHMDIKDDVKAGIKSIALAHDKDTKLILSGLAVTQIGLMTAAGVAAGAGPAFFIGSCGGAAVTLAVMIKRVNLKSVKNCWWWFVNGCWFTGGAIATGLGADYLIRYYSEERQDDSV